MILILTISLDAHADFVIEELKRRGIDFFRFNYDRYPSLTELSYTILETRTTGTMKIGPHVVDLSKVNVVWNRRSTDQFGFRDEVDPRYLTFVKQEANLALQGLWTMLKHAFWVNDFWAQRRANTKILQLLEAADAGFAIPNTLVSNAPESILEFFHESQGQMIMKSLGLPVVTVPTSPDHKATQLRTSLIRKEDLAEDRWDAIRLVPGLYQNFVRKAFEYRVTVFGQTVWAAQVNPHTHADLAIDWRRNQDEVKWVAYHLPPVVEKRCIEVVRRLGLVFGCVDLIETPEGEWVFLEVNPMGQFIFVETQTKQPMVSAFCDLLVAGELQCNHSKSY